MSLSRPVSCRKGVALALGLALAACNGVGLGGGPDAPSLTAPTPDSHSQLYFPISRNTPHDATAGAITCDGCHSPQAATFRQFECIGCHGDAKTTPAHAAVTGYRWASDACYGCHRDGTGASLPPNHDAALFPVTGTKHATVGCSGCHGSTRAAGDLKCVPCHDQAAMASKHAAIPAATTGRRTGSLVTNYAWTSAYCLRCHADGQVNRISAHPQVRHGLSGEGHAPFCLTCHSTLRSSGKTWSADWKTYSCLACHTDNNGGGGG